MTDSTDLPPLGNQSEPNGQVGAILNLSYVVRSVQNELNDYSQQQYKRLLQFAIDGLRFFNIFHNPNIQVVYGQVNSAGIFVFPKDCISYRKIGIYCHGQVVTLTINKNMALNRAQECTEDIRVMESEQGWGVLDGIADGYEFVGHFYNGNYVGGLYGLGGGVNTAYYRVDEVARQVQFNGYIPNDKRIVMEYQSSGISAGTVIGAHVLDPLKRYIHVMRVKHDLRVPMSTKVMLDHDLDVAIIQLRAFNGKFTKDEFLDDMYRAHRQTPKP